MKKDPNRKSFHLLSKSVGNVNLIDLLISMETGSRPRGGVKKITSGIPSIGGEHLNASGGFDFSNIKYVPHSFVEKMTRGRIQKNDILIVKDGATTGKTSFVGNNFPFETAYVNEHVFICRPSSYINPKYLFWFLWSLEGNKKILENFKGSAQGGINTTFASNCKIPLLSIENQNNLVSYIDEQISKVQSAKNLLDKVPTIIKEAKQKILISAITGELTKEWRKSNGYSANISVAWESKEMGELIKSIRSGKSIKCIERPPDKKEIGIVKVSAVSWGKFNEMESKTIPDIKYFNPNYIINKGDFLISRANTTELVGACVIVDSIEKKLMLSDKILKIEFNEIRKEWALFFLQSQEGRSQIEKLATGNQEAMKNISQEKIKSIVIPIPPNPEQKEIIRQVIQLIKKIERIGASYYELDKRLEAIPKNILSSTFKKYLVNQETGSKRIELLNNVLEEKQRYEQIQKEMKKNINIKMKDKKTSEKKQSLIELLKKRFPKEKFGFEDFKNLVGVLEYEQLKEDLIKLIKSNQLKMAYNSKKRTYDYQISS